MKKSIALCFVLICFVGLYVACVSNVRGQSTNIYITADGSVIGTNNIQRHGDVYVLTANISGGIAVQRSNIILDGAGYTLEGYGGTGIDLTNNLTEYPSLYEITNVTIENLRIMNFNLSINSRGSSGNTLYHDYIGNTINNVQGGILLYWNRGGNNITHCTISGTPWAIAIELSSGNSIIENNLLGGILLQLTGNETVDRNYWSDYLTKYPNATEIDSSGIGDTPYMFDTYGAVTGILQDNHPLMKPISIPNFGAPSSSTPESSSPSPSVVSISNSPAPSSSLPASSSTSPSIPEFASLSILILLAAAITSFIILKKRRKLVDNSKG